MHYISALISIDVIICRCRIWVLNIMSWPNLLKHQFRGTGMSFFCMFATTNTTTYYTRLTASFPGRPGLASTRKLKPHTHTCQFNGPFFGTTQASRCQKGRTSLDFTEARDSEWQWHQLGHMQVCTSLQADNHTNTSSLNFYRPDALPDARPTGLNFY